MKNPPDTSGVWGVWALTWWGVFDLASWPGLRRYGQRTSPCTISRASKHHSFRLPGFRRSRAAILPRSVRIRASLQIVRPRENCPPNELDLPGRGSSRQLHRLRCGNAAVIGWTTFQGPPKNRTFPRWSHSYNFRLHAISMDTTHHSRNLLRQPAHTQPGPRRSTSKKQRFFQEARS